MYSVLKNLKVRVTLMCKFELKKFFNQKIYVCTFFLILIMLLLNIKLNLVRDIDFRQKDRDFKTLSISSYNFDNVKEENMNLNDYKTYLYLEATKNFLDGEFGKYNKNMLRFSIICWEIQSHISQKIIKPKNYFKDYESIKAKYNIRTFNDKSFIKGGKDFTDHFRLESLYYKYLYDNNICEENNYSTKPFIMLFNLLNSNVFKMIIFLVFIFSAYIISSEFSSGVIKDAMAIGIGRFKYLGVLYKRVFLHLFLIFILPIILVIFILFLKYGSSDLKYPIITDRNYIYKWENQIEKHKNIVERDKLNTIGLLEYMDNISTENYSPDYEIMELRTVVKINVIIALLAFIFYLCLGIFIGLHVRNSVASILVSSIVCLITVLLFKIVPDIQGTIFDIYNYLSIKEILESFYYTPVKNIISNYSIMIIILILLNAYRFKKMDIIK